MRRPGESNRARRHRLWLALVGVGVVVAALLGVVVLRPESQAGLRTPAALAAGTPEYRPPAAPPTAAQTGILVDRATGRVLWQKLPHARRAPASLTKVMTAVVVLERVPDVDAWCVAPAATAGELGNVIGLRPGERITVLQALRATLIKSANDACLALAYHVAGSEAAFVRLMNAKARELGLDDTRFKNCRGKPMAGHFMSADDLAKLARHALLNARIRRIAATRNAVITWPGHAVRIQARNRLLNYSWGEGVKTGSTAESGACLIGAGTCDKRALILVTLHEPSRNQEEADALKLFAWGDALYVRRTIVATGDVVATVPLTAGGAVRAVAADSLDAVVYRGSVVRTRVTLLQPQLETPPHPGWVLGRVDYAADGESLGTVELVADDDNVDASPLGL